MSFINSIFLFATAAAALPVVIHLVRRMKARTVPFSSLMFLKATPKELLRKRRLRDKLLMALRCALIALLALVFARPFIPAEKIPLIPQRESESVVVLVDRSFSMRYDDAFERAVQLANERIARAEAGDEFAVVAFDEEVQLLAGLEADPAARRASMESLQPGYRATDFFPALQRAGDILQDARNERRVVVLISDFQDAGWTGALENWKLQEGFVFEPVPVGSGNVENAFVQEFALTQKTVGGQGLVRFDAHVASPRSQNVTLSVDGAAADRQTVSARSLSSVSFQHIVPREGFYQGSLTLEEDGLSADDAYYFTGYYGGLPRILVVDEQASAARSDAFFVRSAFEIGDAAKFRVSTAARPVRQSLAGADIVVLAGGSTLSEGERRELRRYVEEGGTLILSGGPPSAPAQLSRTVETLELGRAEAVVDARSELGYEVIIGEVDLRHPIFEPFTGDGSGAILRPRFRRYARLVPSEEAHVVGRFDSGDPFLVERDLGAGRVLFYASTFGTSWTDMPLDEMFVPFLYELVEYGTQRTDQRRMVTVGEAVALSGRPGEAVEVRTPDGRMYQIQIGDDGRGHFRQTDRPGHYAAAGADGTTLFSVNVDPRESDLRRRSSDEVYAAVVPPSADAPVTPAMAAAAVEDDEHRQKLWRSLLLIVIALFALETFVANKSQHRTAIWSGGPGRKPRAGRRPSARGKPAPGRFTRSEEGG